MKKAAIAVLLALVSAGAYAAVDVGAGVDIHAGRHTDLNIGFFYESLAPHGEWVQLKDYGYVWQPAVEVRNERWRPYVDEGHWVWTDDGWFWASDYDWGWAPFHYGRWTYVDDYRWVLVPDAVWGPAWVTFRTGDRYFGWAPLPPGAEFEFGTGLTFRGRHVAAGFDFGLGANFFTFVPSDRFLATNVATVAVAPRESTTIYRNTTIVNNYTTTNNRVVNNGIPVQTVSRATRQEVKPLHVEGATAQAGKAQVSGDKVVAFKPQIRNEKPQNAETLIKEAKAKHKAEAGEKSGAAAKPKTSTQPGTAKPEEKPLPTQFERNKQQQAPAKAGENKPAEQPKANKPAERKKPANEPAANKPAEQKPATGLRSTEERREAPASQRREATKPATNAPGSNLNKPEEKHEAPAAQRHEAERSEASKPATKAPSSSARSNVNKPEEKHEAPATQRHEAERSEASKPATNAPSSSARSNVNKPEEKHEAPAAQRHEAERNEAKPAPSANHGTEEARRSEIKSQAPQHPEPRMNPRAEEGRHMDNNATKNNSEHDRGER